jgi:hypothetical protein
LPFPLSSRPGFPATLHWTRSRVRLSLKERRMRSVNATKFHWKSGGAKPRDLQFRGPFLGMFFGRAIGLYVVFCQGKPLLAIFIRPH